MPSFCAVLDCNYKYRQSPNIPFHKFPIKNKELLVKWIQFTQRPKDWCPSKWMSICGLHFRDEDYRCVEQKKLLKKNAVPSVRHLNENATNRAIPNENKTLHSVESDEESYISDMEESAIKRNKLNSDCRFCGFTTSTFVTFEGNFEIFGVIQKCLPTLAHSIRQDDNMPKEICRQCLKRLRNFARFIDKVLETQTAFQHQFRNTRTNERVIKIKQEPVVRVKQETSDEISALFPDEVDDACGEQDNATNDDGSMDQKFQFCDFPVLNDQDIINNCDIMEIINLSEPFIDITNCENTLAEEEAQQQQQQHYQIKQQSLSSAYELLQSHLLLSEHNYANFSEDLKEEWPIRQYCKKEKIEFDECEPNVSFENSGIEDSTQETNSIVPVDDYDVAASMTITTTTTRDEYERSNKPIVTSVSSFSEGTMLPIKNLPNNEEHQTTSRKKPNIVVLNESIVQSSQAFQLQACTICQSKFFSIDSLNHHYSVSHNLSVTSSVPVTQPMVMVPSSNLATWDKDKHQDSLIQCPNYKTEKDTVPETRLMSTNGPSINTNQPEIQLAPKRSAKNEIKILDMQQTFLQHQYHYPNQLQLEQSPAYNSQQVVTTEFPKAQPQSEQNMWNSEAVGQQIVPNTSKKKYLFENDFDVVHPQTSMPYCTNMPTATNTKAGVVYETLSVEARSTNNGNLGKIANEYMELKRRYRKLQRKCLSLAQNQNPKKEISSKSCYRCRICAVEFLSVFQLLRHKQSTPLHYIRKPASRFFAYCAGCEKFFCRKIALYNHMRYICQSLPLRWLKNQIRTFKCRFCRSITFTHWRLCRKHELKCQFRMKQKLRFQNSNGSKSSSKAKQTKFRRSQKRPYQTQVFKSRLLEPQPLIRKNGPHKCEQCKKVYPTLSSLNQHLITHTNLRIHQCNSCQRIFKRRNGLTQHIRGFHMKLKPYECPTCKHKYALKGDMKRCKHSTLLRINMNAKTKTIS